MPRVLRRESLRSRSMLYIMLKERQKSILEAVIEEYIKSAKPIASKEILDELEFDISPATVRNEMLKLDELGYLEQPHTSAGRVPTDQGYRFYVDDMEEQDTVREKDFNRIRSLFQINNHAEFSRDFSKLLSRMTSAFATVVIEDEEAMFDNGLSELLAEPEFKDSFQVQALGNLVDLLDGELNTLADGFEDNDGLLFIGEENPLKEARSYTMFLSRWQHPRGFRGFFALVGPRRMDYRKNISLIRYLQKNYGE